MCPPNLVYDGIRAALDQLAEEQCKSSLLLEYHRAGRQAVVSDYPSLRPLRVVRFTADAFEVCTP